MASDEQSRRVTVPAERPWTEIVGYSRAVRRGTFVEVAGTSATRADGTVVAPGDAYEQARYILDEIVRALESVGATVSDVVRTRVFLTDIDQWQDAGRAHGEVFGQVRPTSTFVEVSRLLLPEHVVEIEATAICAE
jgi:enamine deaminase RidA (YjgF/YER057c/UK114 family)